MHYQPYYYSNQQRFLLPILAGAFIFTLPFWLAGRNQQCCNNYQQPLPQYQANYYQTPPPYQQPYYPYNNYYPPYNVNFYPPNQYPAYQPNATVLNNNF